MKSLHYYLEKYDLPNWLCLFLFIILVLRIPSFFEPFSYGDEMIYLTLGEGIRQGLTLYKDLHDNKPPLLYIVAGIAGNVFWFKVILALWNLATIILFYKLAEILFPKETKLQKIATVIFGLLTTLPFLEGNIANAELFLIGPVIAAFLVLLRWQYSPRSLITAGVLLGIAALFKIPAAFDLGAVAGFLVIKQGLSKKTLPILAKNLGMLFAGFILPVAATFVWYWARGALSQYWVAAFGQNFGYLSSWRPDDVQKPFLERNGPLLVRAGVVAVGFLLLWWRKTKLTTVFILLSLWLLTALFAITLSERPYPHYLIQALPAGSFFLAMLLAKKTTEQSLVIIPLTLAFFVPVYFKFWSYPVFSYYARFAKLASRQISRPEYLADFGPMVPRNYAVAEFLVKLTQTEERIFVWGDSPPIYALSRRLPPVKYVADYHIRDFSSEEEIVDALTKNPPVYIVVLPGSPPAPSLAKLLAKNYLAIASFDGAVIYKKLYN